MVLYHRFLPKLYPCLSHYKVNTSIQQEIHLRSDQNKWCPVIGGSEGFLINQFQLCIANAFLFILNKKWMQYILLTVLAIGIHSTAILSLIFIPIVVVKWTRKNIFMFFVIIIVISLLYNRIISLFYIIFPQYSIYSNQQFLSTIPTQGTGMIVIYYLFLLCLFLVFLYVINSYNLQLTSVEIKIILSYSISLLLSIIFFKNVLMIRMLWYFSILGIICFPIIIDKVSALFKKDKQARVVIFSLFFVIIFFAYVIQLKKGIDEIVPYITWL